MAAVLGLAACGGEYGGGTDDGVAYTLGGTVSGLRGSGLVLRNNNSRLTIAADGAFTFPNGVLSGTAYAVTIETQPTAPSQLCTPSRASGKVSTANVSDIRIVCATTSNARAWQAPTSLDASDMAFLDGARIAMNDSGAAVAVWLRSALASDRADLWASVYSPQSKRWSAPLRLSLSTDSFRVKSASDPQVAMDADGNAMVVWEQGWNAGAGSLFALWSSRYTANVGWSSDPPLLAAGDAQERPGSPQLVMDAYGNATAVWQQFGGNQYRIMWSRFTASDNAWGIIARLDTSLADALEPCLAINRVGDVMFAWMQSDQGVYRIWSRRYFAGSGGFAEVKRVGGEGIADAFNPRVAMNDEGTALVTWRQTDASLWSNRDLRGGGWEMPSRVDENANSGAAAQVAIDADGNGLIVWQRIAAEQAHLWFSRLTANGLWGPAALVAPADAAGVEHAEDFQMAFDATGRALAIWDRPDGTRTTIRSSLYSPGTGWSVPVDAGPEGDGFAPTIAVGPVGNALAVWRQIDRSTNAQSVLVNRFE